MNIALIFAGGAGLRMGGQDAPKQFLSVCGKPIIIHTLEHFEKHPDIHAVAVVCLCGWEEKLRSMLRAFGIAKVQLIVPGGDTCQASIHNGLAALMEAFPKDALALLHDAVRPMIRAQTITDAILCAGEHSNAITYTPAPETIAVAGEGGRLDGFVERSRCCLIRAPQTFRLHDIWAGYQWAAREGRSFIDSASLMEAFGHTLHLVRGPDENLKITTETDLYTVEAICKKRNW